MPPGKLSVRCPPSTDANCTTRGPRVRECASSLAPTAFDTLALASHGRRGLQVLARRNFPEPGFAQSSDMVRDRTRPLVKLRRNCLLAHPAFEHVQDLRL